MSEKKHCGFVAIIGRPNVGKSTLLNQILGKKISIMSRKPQTTRQQILGIKTYDDVQAIYIDTPGLHENTVKKINRYMNRAASQAVFDADVVVFLIESDKWRNEDQWAFAATTKATGKIILAINKVDKIKDKGLLLPLIDSVKANGNFAAIVPISALHGANVDVLQQTIAEHLPESDFFYPQEQITNQSDRFFVAEVIREKAFHLLGQELPYSISVEIDDFVREENINRIHAKILVEREGQKAIVIGKNGEKLKEIGKRARLDMETYFGKKVFLKLWVVVSDNWSDNARVLKSLGFD